MQLRCAVTWKDSPRGLVLEARPGSGLLALGALGLGLALFALAIALRRHATGAPLVEIAPWGVACGLAAHQGLSLLGRALGLMQRLVLDRLLGELRLESLDPRRQASAVYPLGQLLKLHLNKVDDGTFDPDTLLLIFRGGGAIQFPPAPGRPKELEGMAARVGRFLGIPRAGREAIAPGAQRLRPEGKAKRPSAHEA